MKVKRYCWLALALFGVLVLSLHAQTNGVPGNVVVGPQGQIDFWDLVIGAVSPIFIWGLRRLLPKIPPPLLPSITPLVGIVLGLLINWLAGQNLSWFESAKAGAMAVFFREITNQWVTKRMAECQEPVTPPAAPPAAPPAK